MSRYAYLDELESKSICIIRQAYWQYREKLAVLWSVGKDSTAMLYLIRKSFLGNSFVPVIHIDTGFKFGKIYKFRDKYVKRWNLKLIIAQNKAALKESICPERGRFECCQALKTGVLKNIISQYNFKALLVGIRRDEHAIRAKERYFSPRNENFSWDYKNQPLEMWGQFYQSFHKNETHARIHPLLHWREIDIWRYIKRERIPLVNLYFAKCGLRFRSIGCAPCCSPVASSANSIDKIIKELEVTKIKERSGRIQDKEKEYMMQKLRSLGYM